MKSLQNRPSYEEVDEADRYAQLSSRSDILSKSFTTDVWMKVITRAIDDVALYEFMRQEGKKLKEEELEFEASAKSFLFNENEKILFDDYLVDVTCQKCRQVWKETMSVIAGSNISCPKCRRKISWKHAKYKVTKDQIIKDISLKELISLWGVEDIKGFREGCKRRIQEIIDKKTITQKKTECNLILETINKNLKDIELNLSNKLNKNEIVKAKAERLQSTVDDLKCIKQITSKMLIE